MESLLNVLCAFEFQTIAWLKYTCIKFYEFDLVSAVLDCNYKWVITYILSFAWIDDWLATQGPHLSVDLGSCLAIYIFFASNVLIYKQLYNIDMFVSDKAFDNSKKTRRMAPDGTP